MTTVSPLQVLLARTVHREAQTLLTLPANRTLHQPFARRLRDMCAVGLDAFDETPIVIDEVAVGVADVGLPFVPDLTDLEQLAGEFGDVLRHEASFTAYLADDLAWIGHLAQMHLVRAELAVD